jgi:hypothetical protein
MINEGKTEYLYEKGSHRERRRILELLGLQIPKLFCDSKGEEEEVVLFRWRFIHKRREDINQLCCRESF